MQKESDLISSGSVGKFYKYVNGAISRRGGVGALKDNCGNMLVDDHSKAELLNSFCGIV